MINPLEWERVAQNMRDAGCDSVTIERFRECCQKCDVKGELKVLSRHRVELLDDVHRGQKKIDCLDYLIYQIEKEK